MVKASNVVLVHGAWADGSSWSKVIPLLLKRKFDVRAVQLPLTSLDDDVAATRRALGLLEGPTVLVGHSYGGVVITATGGDHKVVSLEYIAAFAPDTGESAGSLAATAPAPMGAGVRPDKNGFLSLTETGVKENFAHDLSALYAVQAPTAAAALAGKIQKPAWKERSSWYLVASGDRAIQPDLQKKMAAKIKAKTAEVNSSHVAMLARPEDTANLIIDAAG